MSDVMPYGTAQEVVCFTLDELDEIAELARKNLVFTEQNPHLKRQSQAFGRKTGDRYFVGFAAEWAVSDALGIERTQRVGPSRKGNLTALGFRLDVRFRTKPPLMYHVDKPLKADYAVLVLARDGVSVRIAGAISRIDFVRHAVLKDVGHGPSLCVNVGDLMPWLDFKELLKTEAVEQTELPMK